MALRIGCFAVGRIEMWLNGLQISVRQVRRLVKQSTEHQKSEACPKMTISRCFRVASNTHDFLPLFAVADM